MHNKFQQDTLNTFEVIPPTRSNYSRKMRKIAINRPFNFFSAIIELVPELVISNMQNKFEIIYEKLFKLSCPQVHVNADAAELQLQ